jgi:hypothetical protein
MHQYLKTIYALQLMWLCICPMFGQLNVIPTSSGVMNQFTLEDLFRINVINTSGTTLSGKLKASIMTVDQQMVAEVYSQPLRLEIGKIIAGRQITWQRALQYGKSKVSSQLQLNGQLTTGDYAVCYQFISDQGNVTNSNYCFEKEIRPFSQFNLISPYDQETVNLPNPILNWQPLRTFARLNGINYSLKLVKLVDQNQAPERAIVINPPTIQLANLSINSLVYPPAALPLVDGATYVWQVTAYQGKAEIGKTQIWEFTYQAPKKEKQEPIEYAYTYASTTASGHYTLTKGGNISLAYDNHYGLSNLNYDIQVEGEQNLKLKHPEVKLRQGLNLINLPIEQIMNANEDVSLILQIKEPDGSVYYLPVKHHKQ